MERKKLPKAIENYLSPKEKILATHSMSQISRTEFTPQPMYYATDKKIIRYIYRGPIRKPEIDSVLYKDVISVEKVPGRILKQSVIGGLLFLIVASWGMIFWEKWDIFHSGFLLFSCILLFVFGIVFTLVGFAEKRRSCYQITAANQKKWLVRDVTLPTALEFIRVIEEKTSRR